MNCKDLFLRKIDSIEPSDNNIIDLINVLYAGSYCEEITSVSVRKLAEILAGIAVDERKRYIEAILSRYVSADSDTVRQSLVKVIRRLKDKEAIEAINTCHRVTALLNAITKNC